MGAIQGRGRTESHAALERRSPKACLGASNPEVSWPCSQSVGRFLSSPSQSL